MSRVQRNLVIDPRFDPDRDDELDFEVILGGIVERLAAEGTELTTIERLDAEGHFETIWTTAPRDVELRLVEDDINQLDYVIIDADSNVADRIEARLRERLAFYAVDELIRLAGEHMDDDHELVVVLAFASPEHFNPTVADVLIRALGSPLPALRYRAAYAAAMTRWPQLGQVLRGHIASERDPQVADMFDRAVTALSDRAPATK